MKIAYSEDLADKNTKISSLQDQLDTLTTKNDTLAKQVSEYEKKSKAELADADKVSMQLALKYYNDTQYDKAMTELDKVLETSPDYDVALYYKALCYLGTEDEDKAKTAFETFLDKCPDSIYYTVAVSLSGVKTSEDAGDGESTVDTTTEETTQEEGTTQETGTTEPGPDPLNE